MDSAAFDDVAKSLAARLTRANAIRGLAAGALGAVTGIATSADPYVLVNGTKVADDWTDLTTCQTSEPYACLAHAIDMTETGAADATGYVATYTFTSGAAGSAWTADAHCNNWSSSAGDLQSTGGLVSKSVPGWTIGAGGSCVSGLRLYCFQQQ